MIGVVVDNIINNAQTYLMFRTLNKLSKTHDCYMFTNTVQSMPLPNHFAILQQIEALSHRGILISTSVINTQIVLNSLTATQKYFYIWHPEWSQLKELGVRQLRNVLYNDDIDIIARSASHAKLLNKLFKQPKHIVYNWDYESIKRVVS